MDSGSPYLISFSHCEDHRPQKCEDNVKVGFFKLKKAIVVTNLLVTPLFYINRFLRAIFGFCSFCLVSDLVYFNYLHY